MLPTTAAIARVFAARGLVSSWPRAQTRFRFFWINVVMSSGLAVVRKRAFDELAQVMRPVAWFGQDECPLCLLDHRQPYALYQPPSSGWPLRLFVNELELGFRQPHGQRLTKPQLLCGQQVRRFAQDVM